jgi:hypothetical protein
MNRQDQKNGYEQRRSALDLQSQDVIVLTAVWHLMAGAAVSSHIPQIPPLSLEESS